MVDNASGADVVAVEVDLATLAVVGELALSVLDVDDLRISVTSIIIIIIVVVIIILQ